MDPTRVTADTNVFYDLSTHRIKKHEVVGPGEELWATPVNVLEIVAGVSVESWDGRRDAAKAILDLADGMADDPEAHLARQFGSTGEAPAFDWKEACRALAQARDLDELNKGVADFDNRVTRSVNVELARATKTSHYDDFADKVAQACDSFVPGYLAAFRNKTPVVPLRGNERKAFEQKLRSNPLVISTFLSGLGGRYELVTGAAVDPLKPEASRAFVALAGWVFMYHAYIEELVTTGRKPDRNDWGDLELFLYLQPGTYVATAEKKWWTIAKRFNLDHRLKQVTPRAPQS